jgi:acyl phosphate:glycerol-3-phosphate acyltransferase
MGMLFLLSLGTYLLASVNFSILLFKLLGKGDPRNKFSGNAGATNVARQVGKRWGLVILLMDLGRAGAIAQIGAWLLPINIVPLLGLFLVVGNQRPLFHGFRGGKGVASYLGFNAFIFPMAAGVSCLAWIITYGIFRQPFIGSFFMVLVLGFGMIIHFSMSWPAVIGTSLTMALIVYAHKTNIIAYKKEKDK